jgi:polar amino acid transport system permease protein
MAWDWAYAWSIFPDLLAGLLVTIKATALATVVALIVGLLIAILRRSPSRVVRRGVYWPAEFIRRTPILVQIYFVFFVLPNIGVVLSPLTAGVLALGLNASVYMSEVYRAGIDNLARGQWEAAKALGYSITSTWGRLILPQAIPPMIPPLGNYVIIMFKETALLSTISVVELMGAAQIAGNTTYRYLEPFTMVGMFYLAVCLPAAVLIRRLEPAPGESPRSGTGTLFRFQRRRHKQMTGGG